MRKKIKNCPQVIDSLQLLEVGGILRVNGHCSCVWKGCCLENLLHSCSFLNLFVLSPEVKLQELVSRLDCVQVNNSWPFLQ